MSTLIEVARDVLAPIFIVVALSFWLDRRLSIDPGSLSRLVIYLFSPALVFNSLASSSLSGGEAEQLVGAAVVMSFMVAGLAWLIARGQKFNPKMESAFIMSATLINAGNYGIPLNRFAFGTDGESRAVIFYVATAFMAYTVGVFIASRGTRPAREALRNVFYVPLLYAAVLGVLFNMWHVRLPVSLDRSLGLLSDAAIPAMLVVLGIQLSRASMRGQIRPILMASSLRLLAGPLLAFGLVLLFGMSGYARQVTIVQAGMPTAVAAGVLATEFGSDAEFATATILVSTVLSMATLSVLLALVM
jgi:predicted permease